MNEIRIGFKDLLNAKTVTLIILILSDLNEWNAFLVCKMVGIVTL